ncbi:MAG: hypothetical protein IJ238_03525 [Acidaminococcaceae bacterium]|nr:hypothetical protein [Acidaminococcaceae bacterium]
MDMENKDVTLFTGPGLKKEEIKKVMLAGNREAQIRVLRTCRLRILSEVHKKQQELDRLDFCIRQIRETI